MLHKYHLVQYRAMLQYKVVNDLFMYLIYYINQNPSNKTVCTLFNRCKPSYSNLITNNYKVACHLVFPLVTQLVTLLFVSIQLTGLCLSPTHK